MIERLAFALLALFACCAAAQQPPTADEAEFGRYMAERIEAATGAKVEPGADALQLRVSKAGGQTLVANLDRIWSACQRVRERCSAFADEYVRGLASIIAEQMRPPAREALRLAVRPTEYLRVMEGAEPAKRPIMRPYLGDLVVALVLDGERTVGTASRSDLEKLALDEEQAFELARQNLRTRELRPLMLVLKPIKGNAIGYLDENAYESSRMLLHEDWKPYVESIGGNLIVAVPATHILIYGRGDSSEAIAAVRGLAREMARKNQRPLSTLVFRWQPAGWEIVP